MDLAERGGGRGVAIEPPETALPAWAQLGRHAPLDERPAHRRRVGLELAELGGIFLGQRVGDGGEDLRHLHQRPLEPAERRPELGGMDVAVDLEPEIALAGQARGQPAHRAADPGIAPDAA